MNFLQALKSQVLILDGAMGTEIQNLTLTDADFGGSEFRMLSDVLSYTHPDSIRNIHINYFKAGANCIETNTFGASELRLMEYDFTRADFSNFIERNGGVNLSTMTRIQAAYHLNLVSARIAREAIEEYSKSRDYDGRPLFVLGSIGPSNSVLSSTKADLRRGSYREISWNFYNQVLGLIDGGADVLLFETQQDQLELKAAIHGAQKAMKDRGVKLPIMAQVTVDQFGKMQIFNTDIVAALATVQDIGIDVFGINCSIGPDQMEMTVKKLSQFSKLPISIIPNAGLPVSENGKTVFKQTPDDLAQHLSRFITEYGINVVGGCCGTTPAHIAAIANAVKALGGKSSPRPVSKHNLLSGPQVAVDIAHQSSLIRIGERLNVRGSKKVRDAVEMGDIQFDVLEEVVSEQVNDLGVDVIDVCMDSNVVITEETLVSVIKNLTTDFRGVMCIDSFSVEALVQAIEVYPGRPILNSISLEEYEPGLDKIDAVVSRTHQHHPVYVALCTDAEGPAQTADQKAELAKRIYEKCRDKYGIQANQLIIDVNAFPIGSESVEGLNFAMESIRAIRKVKAVHPELMVSMGVGNLTNGLAKKPYMRKVLTSVFMQLARDEGLDTAIINPDHYVPVESLDSEDVRLARQVIVDRNMDAFERLEQIAEERKGNTTAKRVSYDDLPLEEAICKKILDGYKSRVEGEIREGGFVYPYQDGIVPQVAQAIKVHPPLDFINLYLMKAMKELGDGFGRGEVSLPHLLKSADVMKKAMGYIEAHMKHHSGTDVHDEISYKGTIVLGTVYQDVHSIGKDLVKTLLENYGYRVIDLGVQVPLEKFIQTAKEFKATAIGMSALLVQTSNHMITVAKMLVDEGMTNVDVLIGGAPVNLRHAAYVSMHGQTDLKNQLSNVFYCISGMDAVNVMNQLRESQEKREQILKTTKKELKWQYEQAISQKQKDEALLKQLPRREIDFGDILRDISVCFPSERVEFSMKDFKKHLDLKTLFSLNWRYGGKSSWEKKGVSQETLEQKLDEWIDLCDRHKWLIPQAVCGIYPCYSDANDVYILRINNTNEVLEHVHLDLNIGRDKKDVFSIAQYYFSKDTGKRDVIGLQVSTGGKQVDRQIEKFKAEGDTESALILQGLSDRVAEDMAEYVHNQLRAKLGLSNRDGIRLSPGYPGVRNLYVNRIIAKILNAEKSIGVTLTTAHEFDPTGTTGALVCFHPEAKYD